MIGYPGNDSVVVGARGFYRATVHVHGVAGHSGSSRRPGINAIEKASALVQRLRQAVLPSESGPEFPLPPSMTVTAIEGGGGFTSVPDRCRVQVDMRLTPSFGAEHARALLDEHVSAIDRDEPSPLATRLEEVDTWPAYRLEADNPLVEVLVAAAREHVDPAITPRVCGPSNIGNLCATRGVPATCGFGVAYEGVHGADERADTGDIPATYSVYRDAVRRLLS